MLIEDSLLVGGAWGALPPLDPELQDAAIKDNEHNKPIRFRLPMRMPLSS
jgi:hypothetical protein